jgi:hypothetical protein
VFSDVDIWYSYLLKIVKIIEQGKSARKRIQYHYIKANWPNNAELQNFLYNGYEVAGYASNFVSSNDLFAPPAAA